MEKDNYIYLRFMHNIGYTGVRIWHQYRKFSREANQEANL
jgi:hypothetical protein